MGQCKLEWAPAQAMLHRCDFTPISLFCAKLCPEERGHSAFVNLPVVFFLIRNCLKIKAVADINSCSQSKWNLEAAWCDGECLGQPQKT